MSSEKRNTFFSKALFKQSCKANGVMWMVVTLAVCFMLACVMLISGSGSIGETKNAIQDTIIIKEIDSSLEKRAINYYQNSFDGVKQFDSYFTKNAISSITYYQYFNKWLEAEPNKDNFENALEYEIVLKTWKEKMPQVNDNSSKLYLKGYLDWIESVPQSTDYSTITDYQKAMLEWKNVSPLTIDNAIKAAYSVAIMETKEYMYDKALKLNENYTQDSKEANEILATAMYAINPNGMFDDFYLEHNEEKLPDYDVLSIINHIQVGDVNEYLTSSERYSYIHSRCQNTMAIFLAGNLTKQENVDLIVKELEAFKVTKEKYDSFGYTYDSVKHMATTAIITFKNRLDYELKIIEDNYKNGEYSSEGEYEKAILEKNESLTKDITGSLLSSLPQAVSEALEEIGQLDLYSLIVGSIFYKLAGLLLPIIYMIMASNNLISGQVDSGSMAYVLSTSTKRKTIAFTQGVYLFSSLLAMFALTTITGCICMNFVSEDIELTYEKLLLLNLGAFLVLFALSGLCFFTSCYFDRSKRSMAIGGGLSIFALVAAMLGLFGSKTIPSVVRLDSLNYFNYITIISMFDVVSILEETTVFIWKFGCLLGLGLIGYILGTVKFVRKDLPL